jgi:hypothetical protein
MVVPDKRIGRYSCVYLVENMHEGGRTKQRIIANLGRKEMVLAHVDLDRLRARSPGWRSARWCCRWSKAKSLRPALLFGRLWQEVRCRAVLTVLAGERQFAFAAERAVFLNVLHRLFVSGSDRAGENDVPTTASTAPRACSCIISSAPWRGSASRWPIRAGPAPWRRAAARIWSRKSCSPADETCLPSSGGFHGHHQPVLTGTGRRRARPPRPLERLPA